MHLLTNLRSVFTQYLDSVKFTQQPTELYEPNNYFLSIGGKRMRPVLVLLGSYLYDKKYEKVLPAAIAIEYFHNFSLIHDDIMDNAPLRRGKTTVHEKYNTNTAILSGDALLVYAYKFLAQVPTEYLKDVLEIFSDTAIEVCEGQQRDINFETLTDVSEEEYIFMIRQKTSVVLAAGIQIGALIAGAPKEDAEALYHYALNLGIAFQIQDDILDCYGNAELVGKQTGGDIIQNKKTILLIYALQQVEKAGDDSLQKILDQKEFDAAQKVQNVLKIYEQYGVREYVEKVKQNYIQKALDQLNKTSLNDEKKEVLLQLVDYLVKRDF